MACRPRCVHCRQRPIESPWQPFCSARCKEADLGRWLRGEYRIAAERQDPDGPPAGGEPNDEE